jgi:hypothetical protein
MLRPLNATVADLCGLETSEGKIARAGVEALRRVWASADGQALFGLLAMIAHPYASRVRDTPLETGQADGRAEMVAFLISIASGGAVAPEILTANQQANATTNETKS